MRPLKGGVDLTAPSLVATEIEHRYGHRQVLSRVHCALRCRQLIGILGPSGAGKSTLLRILLGLLPPSRGEVHLSGVPLASLSRRQIARQVAYVPQGAETSLPLSVRQVVEMGRFPHLRSLEPLRPVDRHAVGQAIAASELEGLEDRWLNELSGGERQRVLLARAFAQQAPLLILDEPTANLDIGHAHELMRNLRSQVDLRLGVVAAIHDINLAATHCDVLLVLHEGQIVAEGPPVRVLSSELLRRVFGVEAVVHCGRHERPFIEVV